MTTAKIIRPSTTVSRAYSSSQLGGCLSGSRLILLTNGQFAIVDQEDYESATRFKWYPKFSGNTVYAITSVYLGILTGKQITCGLYLHRLIMRPPNHLWIDHINHNGLDCRKDNMRICTPRHNIQGKIGKIISTSKFKGVSWFKKTKKWRGRICYFGHEISIGYYTTEIEAAKAYDTKAKELFGEFAYLNFP